MPIVVEHRPDQLLQDHAREDRPTGLEETFIGRVTIPTHKALLAFLDQRIVDREFADRAELQRVLDTWPEFASSEGLPELSKEFRTLSVSGRNTIACPDKGPGGPLEVGVIKTVTPVP